jgi:hypothetical protein
MVRKGCYECDHIDDLYILREAYNQKCSEETIDFLINTIEIQDVKSIDLFNSIDNDNYVKKLIIICYQSYFDDEFNYNKLLNKRRKSDGLTLHNIYKMRNNTEMINFIETFGAIKNEIYNDKNYYSNKCNELNELTYIKSHVNNQCDVPLIYTYTKTSRSLERNLEILKNFKLKIKHKIIDTESESKIQELEKKVLLIEKDIEIINQRLILYNEIYNEITVINNNKINYENIKLLIEQTNKELYT